MVWWTARLEHGWVHEQTGAENSMTCSHIQVTDRTHDPRMDSRLPSCQPRRLRHLRDMPWSTNLLAHASPVGRTTPTPNCQIQLFKRLRNAEEQSPMRIGMRRGRHNCPLPINRRCSPRLGQHCAAQDSPMPHSHPPRWLHLPSTK